MAAQESQMGIVSTPNSSFIRGDMTDEVLAMSMSRCDDMKTQAVSGVVFMGDTDKGPARKESTDVYLSQDDSEAANGYTEEELAVQTRHPIAGYLNMTKTMIGAGILALPSAFNKAGWALGTIFLFLSASGAIIGISLLFKSAFRVRGTDSSFSKIADKCLPAVGWLIDLAVGIKCTGVAISYLIVVGTLMPLAAQFVFSASPGSVLATKPFWISIFAFLLCFPLACLPSFSFLKYSSFAGLVVVIYVIILVAVFFLFPDLTGACSEFASVEACRGTTHAVNTDFIAILQTIPVFVFAFTCHQNAFIVYNETQDPRPRRTVRFVAIPAVLTTLVSYLVVGLMGYFMYGDNIQSNILSKNYPQNSIPVAVARICMSLVVAVCVPLQIFPARQSFVNLTYTVLRMAKVEGKVNESKYAGTLIYWIVTLVLFVVVYTIAYFVSDLGVVFEVVGATASTSICYVLPGLFTYRLFGHDSAAYKWAGLAFAGLGVVLTTVSLAVIFIKDD